MVRQVGGGKLRVYLPSYVTVLGCARSDLPIKIYMLSRRKKFVSLVTLEKKCHRVGDYEKCPQNKIW